ncbi:hypothetical protein AAG747_14260 [Rapidithrix thailandica]|uniref:Uncharacterized protein n=1 Tax=Rapidithrix thailandica TaxID=413964 RepID=A0AAW9S6E3_9BACT
MKSLMLLVGLAVCWACTSKNQKESTTLSDEASFVNSIEKVHHKKDFMAKEAIAFDFDLTFGGNQVMVGKVTVATNSSRIRIDREDGLCLVYDGKLVYQTPDSVEHPMARFDIFTWPYFFAMPFKLSDPGTQWQMQENATVNERTCKVGKLTFEKGTGDAPDDWYLIHQDLDNHRLYAAVYIVTFGKTFEEANEKPHAISYHDYQEVEGVPMATTWNFWEWNKDLGFTKQLGEARLSNIEFVQPEPGFFSRPDKAKLITL